MSPPVARRKSDLYDGRHAEYPTTPPLPSKPVEVTMPVPQSGYTDTSRESEKPLERELLGDRDHKKRRKSFLSPSPAAPFLAGGAQRVLTPSRATQRVDGRLDESNNEAGSDVDAPDAAATTPSKTVQPNQRAVPVGDEMDLTTVSLDASVTLGIDRTIDLSDGSRGAVSTTGEASSKEQEVRGEVKAVSSGTGQMRGALRIPHVQPTRSRESHSSSLEEDRANLHRADGVVLEGERGQYTGRNTASTSSISMFDSRNPGRSSAPRRVAIRVRAEATTHPTTKESQSSMDPTDAKTNAVEGAWPLNTVVDRNERNSKWEMDDFVVTKNLGQGKFGNVYLAKEKASNMTVALKVCIVRLLVWQAQPWCLMSGTKFRVLWETPIGIVSSNYPSREGDIELEARDRDSSSHAPPKHPPSVRLLLHRVVHLPDLGVRSPRRAVQGVEQAATLRRASRSALRRSGG